MVFGNNENKGKVKPKYSSNQGVAIWENKDKNNKIYLSVKIHVLQTHNMSKDTFFCLVVIIVI
jgi:hypothetical protein